MFALDRDALYNYCVTSEERDREGDYKHIEGSNFLLLLIDIRSNIVR